MAFDWTSLAQNLGNLTTALTSAGVSSANMPSILQQIGLASNPQKNEELALCAQLLQFAGNPTIENQLAMKLLTENGLPQSAASLVLSLMQPGTDIPTRVLQIEQIIRQGG